MLSEEGITWKKTGRNNRLKESVQNEKLCSVAKGQKEKHLILGEIYRQRKLTFPAKEETKRELCMKY